MWLGILSWNLLQHAPVVAQTQLTGSLRKVAVWAIAEGRHGLLARR
jgi:hypothetical protein